MDSLDLVMTESTTINSPVTVTVKAVGSNGLPFDKYTGEFQFLVIAHDNSTTGTDEFSVSGDESVDFPLGGGRINVRASDGNTEKVFTDGFTFRRAGTFTIQVLNRDYEDEVTVIVTEPPVY